MHVYCYLLAAKFVSISKFTEAAYENGTLGNNKINNNNLFTAPFYR